MCQFVNINSVSCILEKNLLLIAVCLDTLIEMLWFKFDFGLKNSKCFLNQFYSDLFSFASDKVYYWRKPYGI